MGSSPESFETSSPGPGLVGHPFSAPDELRIVIQHRDTAAARQSELVEGLLGMPARIAPKFFYDIQGSVLYEAICMLDEYYPPRVEASIFENFRQEIAAALPSASQFVDLGCGDGAKARLWVEPLQVRRYLGVDIAPEWLNSTLQRGVREFPGVTFEGVVTDFTRGLDLHALLAPELPRIFFYPGSSIGNFEPDAAVRLLRQVRRHLRNNDRLLIGVDAPKPRETLIPAYDDALGVTAAFNRNVLRVANRELGADFRIEDFEHRALFDEAASRIEMHLVARRAVRVRLGPKAQRAFERGEAIVTEHSYKYDRDRFEGLLSKAGFGHVTCFTDPRGWFGVYIAAPAVYSQ
ncbi:MAG TPA: L-histidine N(alpha)-methyltransferase [Burkholderiaceae bacterium]|nr:L-histidine N(alpha)-methyltransferase [Burkholderiaceae bacterium]